MNKLDTETIPQLKKDLEPYRDKSSAAVEKHAKAAEKYVQAQEEYFRTPLGKLEKAKTRIDSARDYVSELFNRKRKK